MRKTRFLISAVLAITISIVQAGGVFAAPESQASPIISGTVLSITLETNPNTGITTVVVEVAEKNHESQKVRVSQETAVALGLVSLDGDGNPVINKAALSRLVEIDTATVISNTEVDQHPVGSALATFFSDIPGIDYNIVMEAHDKGVGFGIIAQALWLTQQIPDGSVPKLDIFKALLAAKQNNDYTNLPFVLVDENGTIITPRNWGQLRKAIADGNLGTVMSNKDNNGNGPDKVKDKNKDKDKDKPPKDKEPKDKEPKDKDK